MHLSKHQREKGKTAPEAVEVINLGFASDLNTSAYKVLVPTMGQVLTSNQLVFDESFFQYQKEHSFNGWTRGATKLTFCTKLRHLSGRWCTTHPCS